MNEHQELSWADIKEINAETSRLIQAAGKKLDELIANGKQERKKEKQERKKEEERRKKEEEKREKANERLDHILAETAEEVKDLCRQMGGISSSNGSMAENFFYNAFRKDKIFMNEKYDKIKRNYSYSVGDYKNEYDIVFFNGKSIAIIEVKYKAKPENVKIEDLIIRVERFKKFAPEYNNHKIYLAVAAMSFREGFATQLHKVGIATVHPVGKKTVIYDKEVKVF